MDENRIEKSDRNYPVFTDRITLAHDWDKTGLEDVPFHNFLTRKTLLGTLYLILAKCSRF